MSRKLKKNLIRIIVSGILFAIVFLLDCVIHLSEIITNESVSWVLPFVLYFVVYIIIGYDVLIKAFRNIFRGQVFDENFLMCLATIGAFVIGEFAEAVAVFLLYQIGEWFQKYAVGKSRKSIASLMDIRPDYANKKMENGDYEEVDPSDVKIGDIILVKPGEKVPLDGEVVKGQTSLDTKMLTGESLPRNVGAGSEILSGTINLSSTIEVKVIKEFYDSTVSKILELVESATARKSSSEKFISKFAKYYTPFVVVGAVLVAILGGLMFDDFGEWVVRALNFLVVSCPCALVISVPLTFFSGIGVASRNGILVKGSTFLEKLDSSKVFVFDKTGTLTKGNFEVSVISPAEDKIEILKFACIAEQNSNHPIALSIKSAYEKMMGEGDESSVLNDLASESSADDLKKTNNEIKSLKINDLAKNFEMTDISGKGVKAAGKINGESCVILCGSEKLMRENGIAVNSVQFVGTIVYVAVNGKFLGLIGINDEIKLQSAETIAYLNGQGVKTVMFTGDKDEIAREIASKVGVSEFKSSMLPQDKASKIDELISSEKKGSVICFVGDGINDAPALVKADIGISMGAIGSDAAIEASDIVLMNDDISLIKKAKKISKRTLLIVKENIVFTIAIKMIVLGLSVFGFANMWLAILADVGVSMLAILNSMRVDSKHIRFD